MRSLIQMFRFAGRSLAATLAASVLLLGVPSLATAAVTNVIFERVSYTAPLGQAFVPLRVTVTDELGDPVVGTEVSFSVTPDSGATATLGAPTAMTGIDGVAEIGATAGVVAGFPQVQATADTVSGGALLVNLPPGFRPGEQLASVLAQNQTGASQDIRDLIGTGSFLLIDVCTRWCVPCQNFAGEAETAIQELLTTHSIDLRVAPLLLQSAVPGNPSTQADAIFWKNVMAPSGTVFHAEGLQSTLYRAGYFFMLGGDPGDGGLFPTHLLVGPDGVIIDRVYESTTAEALVARVVAAATEDIGVPPTKLIVIDKIASSGTAKAVFIAKGAGVAKGLATDAADISAVLNIQYDNGADVPITGQFTAVAGAGWRVNNATVAKYVNTDAPTGGATKVSIAKPGNLVKLVGKSLGDTPLQILTQTSTSVGTAKTQYCVSNGSETKCHCSLFDNCMWKPIAGGTGAKLICTGGTADNACETLGLVTGLSHFWGYLATGGTLDPDPVTVEDEFIGPVLVDPMVADSLLVPVNKNSEGIPNAVDHLTFHSFDDGMGGPLTIPGPATAVEVTDQFDTRVLLVGPAIALAVPTETNPGPTPRIPRLDHFLCYSVDPIVPVSIPVSLTDSFQTANPSLVFAAAFCAPAEKNGGPIINAAEHFVMYLHSLQGIVPGAVPIRNQFGTDTLTLDQTYSLAVPATVVGWCGNELIEGSEQCDGTAGNCADPCNAECQCVILPPPPGWTCDPAFYDEVGDFCDCGCGLVDPDCADATVGSCQYCDDPGSCGTGACPANIDPGNNAICTP